MNSNTYTAKNKTIILIIGSFLFCIAFIIQINLQNTLTGWKGIIAQGQVLISIYMVIRIPKYGRIIFTFLNTVICLLTTIQVIKFENYSILPGVIVPIGTIITVQIISHYNNVIVVKNREISEERTIRANQIIELQGVSIMAMAALAETRDNETGKHIQRTKLYVKVLAEYLLEKGVYSDTLNRQMVDLIVASAPLHDIGKVGIPDSILLKPGKLTPDEFEVIKQHTVLGFEAILKAEKSINKDISFLKYASEIILYHHERFNGSGYVYGLSGEDIPLSARIMAVADVYDALIDKRVYKERFSHDKAYKIIVEESGKHFDPVIVDAFIANHETFKRISEEQFE